MQSKIYNNPLFSQGLARLVESYMPNPEREMRMAELDMRRERHTLDMELGELRKQKALEPPKGRAGPRQFDADIASQAAEAIAAGADPVKVGQHAKIMQELRNKGVGL